MLWYVFMVIVSMGHRVVITPGQQRSSGAVRQAEECGADKERPGALVFHSRGLRGLSTGFGEGWWAAIYPSAVKNNNYTSHLRIWHTLQALLLPHI